MRTQNEELDDPLDDFRKMDPLWRADMDQLFGVVVTRVCRANARRRRLKLLVPPMTALAFCIATVLVALCTSVDYPAMKQNAMVASWGAGDLERAPATVCQVTGTIGVEWAKTSKPPACVDYLTTGQWIKLDSGLLELTYVNGGRVVLQGPVTYEVAENGGYLASGGLVARSHDRADNSESAATPKEATAPGVLPLCGTPRCSLAIRTRSAIVADLGDAFDFGVRVDVDDSTHVQVFKGVAALCSTVETWEQCVEDAVPPPYRALHEGEAVKAFVKNAPFGPVACCIAVNSQPEVLLRDFKVHTSSADSVNTTPRP